MRCLLSNMTCQKLTARRLVSLFVLAALVLSGACTRRSEPPVVIAQVGDANLTMEDLRSQVPDQVLNNAGQQDLLEYVNQWMRSELLYQTAEEMGYGSDSRVERRARQARRDIIIDVFLEDELDMRPFISDREISSYYQNNLTSFTRAEAEVQAEILWFEDAAHAELARGALNEGRTFSEVAADSAFGIMATNLESRYLSRIELGDELGDAVFGIREGTLSRPVQVDDSYVLIRVVDRQEAGSVRSMAEIRDEILMRLTSDLRDMKLDELLSRLLELADVSINIEAGLDVLGRERLP